MSSSDARCLGAWAAVLLLGLAGCAGAIREPSLHPTASGYPIGYVERGMASWYGPGFHGNRTANGERYDMHRLTAAHRTLPLGTVARVRSLTTGRLVTVRINDRGPFARNRILDLSYAAAQELGMIGPGTDKIELQVIGYEGRAGAVGVLYVQVGSFADFANAQALVARLRARHPDVRIVPVELEAGRRYRVQVGRYETDEQARAAAHRLEQETALETLVMRDDA